MKFNNIRIGIKLSALIGCLSMLLLIIGIVGLGGISKSNETLDAIYQTGVKTTGRIAEIQKLLLGNRLAIARALVTPSPEFGDHTPVRWNRYVAATITSDPIEPL